MPQGEGLRVRLIGGAIVLAAALASCGQSSAVGPGAPDDPAEAPAAEFRPWAGGDTFVMIIPEGMTEDQMRVAAKQHCEQRQFCKVLGWTAAEEAATGFPLTDREVETLAFNYSLNRVGGMDAGQWDCRRFARNDPAECLTDPEPAE